MNVRAARQGFDEESAHDVERDPRQHHAASRAQKGQQQAFGEHLADKPRTPRADGRAHGHLALALDAARQQQPGHVDAADGQHRQDSAQQRPQRPLALAGHSLFQTLQANRAAFVGRICFAEVLKDVRHIGLRLSHADAVPKAAHRPQPMVAATGHPRLIDMHRHIDGVAHVQRKAEARGHDANDDVVLSSKLDGLIQNAAIAAQIVFPDLITQNGNVVLSVLLFAGQKRASQQRLHTEDLKEVVRCLDTA